MDLSHIILLSAIEGATEFLPISSTAHLILASHALGIPSTDFRSTFEIAIQIGAIGAVTLLYFKKIVEDKALILKAVVGFIPTGILGFTFFKHIKILLNDPIIPIVTLFIGGLAIIAIEYYFQKKASNKVTTKTLADLTYKDSLIIGLIQSISMVPGVSRAAASIFAAMALKYDRTSAVEFSFLLAIPTIATASSYDLLKSSHAFTSDQIFQLGIGIVASFVFALIVIKWLMKFVATNNFIGFGVYRVLLAIAYLILFSSIF